MQSTSVLLFEVIILLSAAAATVGSMLNSISKIRNWDTRSINRTLFVIYILSLVFAFIQYLLFPSPYDKLLVIAITAMAITILSAFSNFAIRDVMFPSLFKKGTDKDIVQRPDSMLQNINSNFSGKIFISYRRSDSADVTGRIYDRLVAKFGREFIFKDVDSIPLGSDFKEHLARKVSECDVLLAVIGDSWLSALEEKGNNPSLSTRDFVRIEIQSALERNIPVIPLLVRGAKMPNEDDLPADLQKLVYRNGIPIRSDPDFHRDMDRLISGLENVLGR